MTTKQDILYIAHARMVDRIPTLDCLRVDKGMGLEGWFKIELYHALILENIPVKIKGKGPDLDLGAFKLEVKAAQAKSASWVRKDGLKYPGVDCLFLGPQTLIESLEVDHHLTIDDYWIVGIIYND